MKITDKIGLLHQNQICKKLYVEFGVSSIVDLGADNNPYEKICSNLSNRQLWKYLLIHTHQVLRLFRVVSQSHSRL
jgi:hypothetical protein